MGETRIKSGRKNGFVVLGRTVAQDARLSLEARGLFALMASLPDNWDYTVSGLAVKAGCGKDKIRRLLGQLQSVGYLIREQSHDNGGKFAGNVYVLQDEAPPLSEKPDNGEDAPNVPLSGNTVDGENRQREKPLTEIPTQNNKDLKEYEKENPPYPPKGDKPARKRRQSNGPKKAPDWKPERFEGFWRSYPCGKSKQAAIKAWDKLRPDDGLLVAMAKGLQRALASEDWQRGIGIPYASTWINNRRWEDEDKPLPAVASKSPRRPKPRKCHVEMIDGEEVVVYDD